MRAYFQGIIITSDLRRLQKKTPYAFPVWSIGRKRGNLSLTVYGQRIESTLEDLHRALDEKKMDQLAQLNNAMQGLNVERNILNGIPTWPWRLNTLTTFLSTLWACRSSFSLSSS